MQTQCNQRTFGFEALGRRKVVARFDGGPITSDAGGLLLREVEQRTGIVRQLTECFTDHRDVDLTEHGVEELLRQRIFGLALGYADLNDHDQLRHDPLLATLVGKRDPTGDDRVRRRDRDKALAGRNTLNRLELTPPAADAKTRYKKIVADTGRIEQLFVNVFVQLHARPPERIVLDLDATDDQSVCAPSKNSEKHTVNWRGEYVRKLSSMDLAPPVGVPCALKAAESVVSGQEIRLGAGHERGGEVSLVFAMSLDWLQVHGKGGIALEGSHGGESLLNF